MCATLAILMLIFFSINPAIAQDQGNQQSIITQHEPKSRLSEARKLSEKKSSHIWLWALLGIAIAGGGVAAVAGGGSSGDDGNGGSNTGDYNFSW